MTRQPVKKTELTNIRHLVNELSQHTPYDQMAEEHVFYLVESAEMAFYAKGDTVLSPDRGVVGHFFIVKQGRISGTRQGTEGTDDIVEFDVGAGECFPLAALLGERPTRTVHLAAEDTFCLEIPKTAFDQVFQQSKVFREFCVRGVSMLLDQVHKDMQNNAASSLGQNQLLSTPLQQLISRQVICCSPTTSIYQAVDTMHQHNIGSIIISSDQLKAEGIFTLRDLRRVIASGQVDLNSTIASVMTTSPICLDIGDQAFDAALLMARHHFGHVVVTEKGLLRGVVSERNLFSLQRVDLVHLARSLAKATSVESLAEQRQNIHKLIESMLAHGAAVNQVTRIITQLNDITVQRCIALCIGNDQYPAFTWVAFGSEARKEQALFTDQDNGILFADHENPMAIREQLLPLAKRITTALNECGFDLCPGNIMASNEKLCLSQREWKQRFGQIITTATPENLLDGSIYFDIRAVWGDATLLDPVKLEMFERISEDSLFQHHMAVNALDRKPPLNFLGDFSVSGKGEQKNTLDLKTQGLTPFVAGARLLSLSHGIDKNNTVERLLTLAENNHIKTEDANAWIESYEFIQLLRLRLHQWLSKEDLPLTNRIDPKRLNQLERNILKEAFRQARRLQKTIAIRYQV